MDCEWQYATICAEGKVRDSGWGEDTAMTTFWVLSYYWEAKLHDTNRSWVDPGVKLGVAGLI